MKVTGIKSYACTDDEGKLYFIAKVETDEGIYGAGRSRDTAMGKCGRKRD